MGVLIVNLQTSAEQNFISRLAALVPRPRVNLTRFHGVFAPNSKYRARVTPAKRGKGRKTGVANDNAEQTPAERHAAMTWAQRLKRVFDIDIETCSECGGDVKIIASIEDPVVIKTIIAHLDKKGAFSGNRLLPDCRASPGPSMGLLIWGNESNPGSNLPLQTYGSGRVFYAQMS